MGLRGLLFRFIHRSLSQEPEPEPYSEPIRERKPTKRRHVSPPVFRRDIRPYEASWHVEDWQAQMRRNGWQIDVDGHHGPHSQQLCRAIQRAHRLPVTGVVDRDTWNITYGHKPEPRTQDLESLN